MAEDQDGEQKTEDPSARKLDQARDKGQVALSREIGNWFTLGAVTIMLAFVLPPLVRRLTALLTRFLADPRLYTGDGNLGVLLIEILREVGLLLVVPALLMVVAGIAGPLLQNGFVVAPERLVPQFSYVSPLAGLKRLFSVRSLVEFLKNLVKLAVVGSVLWLLLRSELDRLPLLPTMDVAAIGSEIARLVGRMMIAVVAVLTAVALLDLGYQRLSFRNSMRMTKQEVKDEYKQVEGDPRIKAKLRQIRVERARRGMMAAVPTATVVVTNPTHYAIAFKYEMETMAAPIVVAKGADLVAQRIREIARANNVPLVENPPLARALYASVEIDSEIPPEHYKAVAEIIGYVFRLQGKLRTAPAPGAAVR